MTAIAVVLPLLALVGSGGVAWGVRRLEADSAVSVPWWLWAAAPLLALVPLIVPLAYVVVVAYVLDRLDIVSAGGLVDRTLDVVMGTVDTVLDWLGDLLPSGLLGVTR